MKINYGKLIIAVVLTQLAGIIGGLFTSSSVDSWYVDLIKPSFNPPSWLFSPVWITLYLLMGIALYLVWVKGTKTTEAKVGLGLFGGQLVLNTLWSILFFGLQNPLAAFVEIIVLWLAILGTIIYFYKIKKVAAYLLIPYILWVSFAALLNYYLMILN